MTKEDALKKLESIISHGIAITTKDIVEANSVCASIYHSDFSMTEHKELGHMTISTMMLNPWSAFIVQKFDRLKVLPIFLPAISDLKRIPQDKKDGDVLSHTITVLNYIDILFPHKGMLFMKYAALFHDSGKKETMRSDKGKTSFYGHESESAKHLIRACKAFDLLPEDDLLRAETVVKNHMFPLAYQRNPDWGIDAVRNFVERCHGLHDFVIDLAIADKRANSANKEYIEPLLELKKRCKEI